ncbi:hypothetical protein A0H81_10964 [Grifola frondosa]|uniref:Mid2 domain-containing protein n=1 Tax=Grifola frondosa TaxID=5627 RepID=A0A1C7LX84_GRIFR|nr:hypothetical protein A0H81_10964 [Grifola frondosa]
MHSSRLSYSRAHHKRASGIAVRDNDILDGLLGDFTKSASTTTQSFILPGTTILRTQVVTLEVPVTTTSISLTTPTTTLPSLSSSETSSATSSSVPSVTDTATSSSTPSSTSTSSNTTSETTSDTTTATTTSVTQTLPSDTSAISTDTVKGSLQGAIAQSHGLSGGAVAGIVIAILFIVLAVVVYFVRKRFLRRRKERRNTWGAGLYPKPDLDFSEKLSVPTRPSPEASRYTDVVPPPMGGIDAARPSPMKQAQPLPAVPPNSIRAAPSPNPFVPVPAPLPWHSIIFPILPLVLPRSIHRCPRGRVSDAHGCFRWRDLCRRTRASDRILWSSSIPLSLGFLGFV